MKITLLLFVVLMATNCLAYSNEDFEELLERVEELELELIKSKAMSSDGGIVKSFTSPTLKIGGLFQGSITALNGPDTESQAAADSSILGLNFAADINDRLSFVTQVIHILGNFKSPTHQSTRKFSDTGLASIFNFMAHGYGQYYFNKSANLKFGLGWVPFGRTYEQTELIIFRRAGRSQLGGSPISASLWQGLNLGGLLAETKKFNINYNLYSFTSPTEATSMGYGGRVVFEKKSRGLILGTSVQKGSLDDGKYYSAGLDFEVKGQSIGFITEFAYQFVDAGTVKDVYSGYIEPYFNISKSFLFFIYSDYLNNPQNLTSNTADPIKLWENGLGVNWSPFNELKFRLTTSKLDYRGSDNTDTNGKERDYYQTQFTSSLVF